MHFDNISIRPLTLQDQQSFFDLIDRNRLRLEALFSGTVSRTKTLEDTKAYVLEVMEKIEKKIYLPFLVINIKDNSPVGFIDIKNIDWNLPKGELGCFIDKDYENKGISKKVMKMFTEYCFDHYGFNKLFLRTHESNYSARKIAEACGFEIEGTLRRDYKTTTGELVDLIYYGLIRN